MTTLSMLSALSAMALALSAPVYAQYMLQPAAFTRVQPGTARPSNLKEDREITSVFLSRSLRSVSAAARPAASTAL